jgi:Helix-turn-helix domain of resolvase
MSTNGVDEEQFFRALTALEGVLDENANRARLIKRRITRVRRLREQGMSYSDLVTTEDGPLIVHLLTESSTELDNCGASVRRAEARALYEEGMTMEQIAESFGVTRQRVSALLRTDSSA